MTRLSLVTFALVATVAVNARAEAPRLTVDDRLPPSFAAVTTELRARLSGPGLDATATVEVLGAGNEAIVHVTLSDGRSAVRRVATPDGLVPAVLALLVVPPAAPRPPPEPPLAQPTPEPPPGPSFELGLGASAHLTVSPSYFGYGTGAFAQVVNRPWVVGLAVRWDVDDLGLGQSLPNAFNMQSFHVAALVGRRFGGERVALDVLVGPDVGVENQEALPPDVGVDGIGGTYADASLVALGRVTLPMSKPYRFFTSIDL
jgi:hypothetical protein